MTAFHSGNRKDGFLNTRYFDRRTAGMSCEEARISMNIDKKRGHKLEALWRAEKYGTSVDATTCKFAHDPEYVDLILEADPRGFGRIEGGQVVWG